MEISFSDGTILELSKSASTLIQRQIKDLDLALESGGVLLGSQVIGESRYVITELTLPTPKDRRGRFFFIRSRLAANKVIKTAWKESLGTVNYLGEWHTHDEPIPTPSETDLRLLRNVIRDESCKYDKQFMLIFAQRGICACMANANDELAKIESVRLIW